MSLAYDSNLITRDYFDSLLLETRYIDSDIPSTKTTIFGKEYSMPIATAALSHLHNVCENGMSEFALGAKNAGALCFIGMGENEDLENMVKTGADIVRIIKPLEKNEDVLTKINHAIGCGAVGVGMDIDHAYSGSGTYDNVYGLKMKSKSFDEMKEFVSSSSVPFVVKGVLSVSDALKAADMGASAIIVSHHHGIMPYSVPPLMILPEIAKAVEGRMTIFADCGIQSGMDVFKALALGADAVCVGRDLMESLKEKASGVSCRMNELNNELKSIMARTGFHSVDEIDSSVIHKRTF